MQFTQSCAYTTLVRLNVDRTGGHLVIHALRTMGLKGIFKMNSH